MPTITSNDPKPYTDKDARREYEHILMEEAQRGATLKGRVPANIDEAQAAIAADVEASRRQWSESHTDPAQRPLLFSKTSQYESSPTHRLSKAFARYEPDHPVEQLYRGFAQKQLGLETVRRPHVDPKTGTPEVQLVHDYSPWYQKELAKGKDISPQRRAVMHQWLNTGRAKHFDPYRPQERPTLTGRTTEAASQVDPTRKMQFRYRVMGLNEPIASNLPTGQINPTYDPSLQPRQRERAASQAQIEAIARHLEPAALLNPAASWAEGPPIVAGGMVESGNARTLALRRAAEINPKGYESYKSQLLAQAEQFGLKPDEIRQMQHPVLVRERLTPMEGEQRLKFVNEANASGVARMGAAEQARADARLIPPNLFANLDVGESDTSLGDTLRKRSNMPVTRGFFERLPETERAALMTAQGELSTEGTNRLERAMFSYALPGPSGERLSRHVFEEGETLDRIPQGIRQALPSLGKMTAAMQAGHRKPEYAIGEDLATVTGKMRDIKQQGLSVDDYLRQHKMFGEMSPFQQQLMSQLHERRQSGRQVGELLNAYAGAVERTPPPGQGDMFGGNAGMEVTREGLLRTALKEVGGEWHTLEQSAAGPQAMPKMPDLANKPTAASPVAPPGPTLPDSDPVGEFLARRAAGRQRSGSVNTRPTYLEGEPAQGLPQPSFPQGKTGGAGGSNRPPRPPVTFATPEPEEPGRSPRKLSTGEAMDISATQGYSAVNWGDVDWRGKPVNPPEMERLQQGRYRPGDLVNIAAAGGDTRLASAYLRSIRTDSSAEARRQGREIGQERIGEDMSQGGVFSDVREAQGLVQRQRGARQDWQSLNVQHQVAMDAGDFGQARKLEKQMNTLRENITEWGDSIKAVQPALKEHAKLLTGHNKQIDAEISQLQGTNKAREALRTRLETAAKQYDPGSPEATANALQRAKLEKGISARQDRIERLVSEREAGRTLRGQLEGVSPLAAPRAARGAPPSFGQEAGGILKSTFNPQNLFYGMSNLAQMRQEIFGPLMQARDAYQQSQFTRGQMNYSLGMGGMGGEVGRDRANQAARSDAWTEFGKGVNQALQPIDDWVTRKLRGQKGQKGQEEQSTFSQAGYYGTWGALGLTGLMGQMLGGIGGQGGAGLIGSRLAQTGFGSAPVAGPSMLGAGLAGLGGVVAGVGVNEAMAGSRWNVGAAGEGALSAIAGLANPLLPAGIDWLREKTGTKGTGEVGFESLTKYPGAAMNLMGGAGGTGAGDVPVPVSIEKINKPDDLVRALGQTSARAAGLPLDQYQFSEDQLRQVVKEFAESSGLDFTQLKDMKGQGYQVLQRAVEMGVKSGLDPEQLTNYFAKAPAAAGYTPGGQASLPFLDYISQSTGITDLSNRMQGLQATQREAQFAGFNPQQQVGIAGRYQEIGQQEGEFRAGRELSKLVGGNAYDYSDLARRAGRSDMAMMDEQGRPMHQAETYAIQDRQREWQDTTQQTRQGQEIEWQQERYDLEQRFWDFRQERRQEDYQFQIRQFDLTKKQMEYNIGREEQQAQMQNRYQEQQFALSKKIFDLQTKYQRQDFDKQEQRMGVQRGWQLQNQAWNRESFELQAGWQQEDLERALRYSSGRERMDIRRQLERSGIMAERQRTEFDRTEERSGVQYDWAQEDLATNRARFEEMRVLQEQQMELSRSYWEEQKAFAEEDRATRKAMQEEQLQLMTDRHSAWLSAYGEETALTNDQHGLEREMATEKLEWAAQDFEEAKRRAEEEKQILEWQRQAIEVQQQFNLLQSVGWQDAIEKAQDLRDIHREILRNAQEWADISSSQAAGAGQGQGSHPGQIPGFAMGGPVRRPTVGLLGEEGEEYVVPSAGALVMRSSGNNEDTELLREAVTFLRAISAAKNGTITIDLDALRQAGFVSILDFDEAYP